jgi:NAD(P)-dependent dehydrogenase (short-subunit alcohol dehydrogenase family)
LITGRKPAIFVSNARPEASEFFKPPMDITLKEWGAAFDSQAKGFLIAAREAAWITGQTIYADGGASLMTPEVPPEIQLG